MRNTFNGHVVTGSSISASNQTLRLDTVGGVMYLGEAAVGADTSAAVWRIKRITEVADDLTIEFADGDAQLDNVWDNRTLLNYS